MSTKPQTKEIAETREDAAEPLIERLLGDVIQRQHVASLPRPRGRIDCYSLIRADWVR